MWGSYDSTQERYEDSPPASMFYYLFLKERGSLLQVSLKGGAVSLNPEDRKTADTDGSVAFLPASTLLSPGVGRPGNLLQVLCVVAALMYYKQGGGKSGEEKEGLWCVYCARVPEGTCSRVCTTNIS